MIPMLLTSHGEKKFVIVMLVRLLSRRATFLTSDSLVLIRWENSVTLEV